MKFLVAISTAFNTKHIDQLIASLPPNVLGLAAVNYSGSKHLSDHAAINILALDTTKKRQDLVMQANEHACAAGASHLVILDATSAHFRKDIDSLIATAQQAPEAIIVGHQPFSTVNQGWLPHIGRRLGALLFRLQTGIALPEPAGRCRVYPVAVLKQLRCWTKGSFFETESMVRAVWAGVAVETVALQSSNMNHSDRSLLAHRAIDIWVAIAMQVHLTMRSITPWPHRKLQPNLSATGKKISVLRPLQSIRTLLTENLSPRRLALAGALGVFLGALPLIALHSVAILFAAGYFRLNKVAALAASQLCMPPLVPALCIEVGYLMRHGRFLTEISFETIGRQALERIFEWVMGSLVVAPVLAIIIGAVLYLVAKTMQRSMQSPSQN